MGRLGETSRDHRDTIRFSEGVPADHLFVLLECNRPLSGAARYALSDVDEIVIGRGDRRAVRRESAGNVERLFLTIPDRLISSAHARLLRHPGGWVVEDLQSTNGVLVDGVPVTRKELADRALIECGRTILCIGRNLLTFAGTDADVDITCVDENDSFATVVPSVAKEFGVILCSASSPAPVLFLAETGAGKEVTARAMHRLSRRKGAFVAVNCGALAASLTEDLLFGHVRGAFSGALKDECGLIRAADGGTLFLDEIGDLPMAAQPTLLRVLQEKEVMPIGSTRPVSVDLRVIAATHRSLPDLTARGDFRHDLLARLDGFTFTLPPVRERIFDLALFLGRILRRLGDDRAARLRFTPEAARALFRHAWPSNIREFEQCILRALTLSSGDLIARTHIAFGVIAHVPSCSDSLVESKSAGERARDDLPALLRSHAGNVAAVARDVGKAPVQVRRWMKKLGLDPNDFRS